MLTLKKNNKTLEEAILQLAKNCTSWGFSRKVYSECRYSVSENTDKLLIDEYNEFGLNISEILLPKETILNIPFNKNIDLTFLKKSSTYKPYIIKKDKYEPSNYSIISSDMKEVFPLVRFSENIELPMICEDNIGWMSPTLFEYETMKKPLAKAFGNVLTFGLGIGFFQYNCLCKENVSKITVIEKNKDVIRLFKENILPQFPRQDCIEIIEGDAFDYFNESFVEQYDYTFVDIWRTEEDGAIIVSKLLKQFNPYNSTKINIDFWIENNIFNQIKKALLATILFILKGSLDLNMKNEKLNETDKDPDSVTNVVNYFKKVNVKINNKNDLLNLLNDKNTLLGIIAY